MPNNIILVGFFFVFFGGGGIIRVKKMIEKIQNTDTSTRGQFKPPRHGKQGNTKKIKQVQRISER